MRSSSPYGRSNRISRVTLEVEVVIVMVREAILVEAIEAVGKAGVEEVEGGVAVGTNSF